MKNTPPPPSIPVSPEEKCLRTSLIIGVYFILSSFVYFLNPLRLTEEIRTGFFAFVLGKGDTVQIVEDYFADYSIMDLIGVVSAVWIVGLVLCLAGIAMSFIGKIRSYSHYPLFAGGLALLVASLTSAIGAGYYSAVDSDALKGMIFVDMPLGALIGFPAAGAICASSGWVLYGMLSRLLERSRQSRRAPGRLRALGYDDSRPRSYLRGLVGALLGMLTGGLPWIILITFDVFGAFFGISMGFLIRLFYGIMGGKNGKLKYAVLLPVAVLGVPVIEVLGYSSQIAYYILSGEIVRRSFFDLWGDLIYNVSTTPSLLTTVLVDTGVGILFSVICVSGIFTRRKGV